MSISIEELKIKISTNIISSSSNIIDFKRSMLYHPELVDMRPDLNEYPYFTFDLKYSISSLRYLPYKDRVEFFFNKEKFTERVLAFSKEKTILDITKTFDEKEKKKYYRRKEKNIEKNILTMIELLFPTKFPVINDIQTSYDVIQGNIKVKNIYYGPIVTNYYSYLKINDEIYTIKKNIWVNDILNHPVYQRLITEYHKVWLVLEEKKLKIKRDIPDEKQQEPELERIDEYFTRPSEEIRTRSDVPREYTQFTSVTLNDYKSPRRESSNIELQELINGAQTDKTGEFYTFMKFLYDRYFYLTENVTSNNYYNDNKNKMKVGLCSINIDVIDTQRREIYIYTDFIKGEVNKENERSIWCPFVSDYLGNQLEVMIINSYSNKLIKRSLPNWNIFKNRMIFSIKKLKDKKSKDENPTKKLMLEEKPFVKSENSTKKENNKDNSYDDVNFRSNFLNFILKRIDKKEKETLLNDINGYTVFVKSTLSDQNLLDFVKKNENQVYSLIKEWNKDLVNQNVGLIHKLNTKLSNLKGELENTKYQISIHKNNTRDRDELIKEQYKEKLLNLFISITNVLLELEKQKKLIPIIRGGGTRKKYINKRYNTRKTRKT